MPIHKPLLKPVTGKNRYCGPTALATFTGLSKIDDALLKALDTSGNMP